MLLNIIRKLQQKQYVKTPGEKVIHVDFKSGSQHYFGSIAAIFETFDSGTIGISQQGLYDYGLSPDRPYENKFCKIYEGSIRRKRGNRKNPGNKTNDKT